MEASSCLRPSERCRESVHKGQGSGRAPVQSEEESHLGELVPKNFLLQPFLSRFIFKMVPKPDDEYVQLKWYSAMRAWSEFVGVNDAKAILVRPRIDRVRPISPQNRVDLHVFPSGFFRGIFRTRACTRTSQAARASDAP